MGRATKPGRTLTVAEAEVFALKGGAAKLRAKLMSTLLRPDGRPDVAG